MKMISRFALATIGSLSFAGAAMAADRDFHLVNVVLPDGSIQQLRYSGKVAPTLIVVPGRGAFAPLAFRDVGMFRSLAMFDRIAAEMDRRVDAMLRQAAALSAQAPGANGQLDLAAARNLPPGTIS
jgi:hypothetical protein